MAGALWRKATLVLKDEHLLLHVGSQTHTIAYENVSYVTVSWLGTIRFYLEDTTATPQQPLSFWSTGTLVLLNKLTNRGIPAGGHVLRRLLVSQVLIYSLLYATLLVIFGLLTVTIPSWRHDSGGFFDAQILVMYTAFAILFPLINLRKYIKNDLAEPQDEEEWFKWD